MSNSKCYFTFNFSIKNISLSVYDYIFQKPHLRITSIQCYVCLLLNTHFLTEAGMRVFILGCISAGIPKTEANWEDVRKDLQKIENLIQPRCKVTAMNCFLLELEVISHESRDGDIEETVKNLILLANSSLSSNGVSYPIVLQCYI
uniref:interleukin-15 n=1 Tax=Ictidomys tridecemlineatus TaxID=43179 RepID=UPI001A9D6007|nr:interleukin-15 [Ictidomys tridecemlineatus]